MFDYIYPMIVGLLAQFMMSPTKAAKWAKYLLKARDYLNLLFPESIYPKGGAFDDLKVPMNGMTNEKVAVPIEAVKEAAKSKGFNIPFVKGR